MIRLTEKGIEERGSRSKDDPPYHINSHQTGLLPGSGDERVVGQIRHHRDHRERSADVFLVDLDHLTHRPLLLSVDVLRHPTGEHLLHRSHSRPPSLVQAQQALEPAEKLFRVGGGDARSRRRQGHGEGDR